MQTLSIFHKNKEDKHKEYIPIYEKWVLKKEINYISMKY